MSERIQGETSILLSVVSWILLLAGLGILVYELARGGGFSLVGAGVAAVGGVMVWSRRRGEANAGPRAEPHE